MLVGWIERGLGLAPFRQLVRALDTSESQLGKDLGFPSRTLTRRRAGTRFTREESERIVRLARVVRLATEFFNGDLAEARDWLSEERRALGGRTPVSAAQTEVGAREVEALLVRMEDGVFF